MTQQSAIDDVDTTARDAITDGQASSDDGQSRRQRVSRWDRPSEPRDWRFWVGNVGRVLIAAGLLLFGFVAYQLWGTGIETARAQSDLERQFESQLGENDASAPPVTASDGGGDAQPAVDPDTDRDTPTPTSGSTTLSSTVASTPDDKIPAAVAVTADPAPDDAVDQPPRRIVPGEVLARLEIPRIDRTDYVVPGVSLDALKKGPGHFPDTPLPGQLGNAAIAGHRTTYGAPFFDVDQLQPGDEMIVTYSNGDRFVYEVTFTEIVSPSDYRVVTTTNFEIAEMTLTSCAPKWSARERIVIHSLLNAAKSSPVGTSTFYELEPEAGEQAIVVDDPVIIRPEIDPNDVTTIPPATAPGSASASATTAVATSVPTSVATTVPTTDVPVRSERPDDTAAAATDGIRGTSRPDGDVTTATGDEPIPIDAFRQGWFDDRAAFSQIALWMAALIVVVIGGYQTSKRFRHDSVGILIGVVPFLVTLYFVYQNVNRLLPPGI